MQAFSVVIDSPLSLAKARAEVATGLVGTLAKGGYSIARQDDRQVDLTATWRSTRVWVFSVITFPFGLLLFLGFPQRSTVSVMLAEQPNGGTSITIVGLAPPRVAEQVRSLAS